MPPEPFPWDRKEFFKERKHNNHERPNSDPIGPFGRWRENTSSSSHGSRYEFGRWAFMPEFRRPSGHNRQGGWHMYQEVPGHGYPTPRDRFMEEDGFRPFGPRADGRYSRNFRESRGSFNQKDYRSHVWVNNHSHNSQTNATAKPQDLDGKKSVDGVVVCASRPDSDSQNASDQSHEKDPANKPADANEPGMVQRVDKGNSLGVDWKPLKWSRAGSLTSRGSGFSHSSSSRSIGGESSDTKSDLLLQNATAGESPSGDPFACTTSAAPSEETGSRKKPRLGWGEGLAKYEKKKVDVPEENANKNGTTIRGSNGEQELSLASSLAERSPRAVGFSDCASPATPSSVGCSSSPGMDDRSFAKVVDMDIDASNHISVSPTLCSLVQLEGYPFKLEDLEHGLITNLGTLLSELLQSEDQNTMDSGSVKCPAMNKLLLWKRDITKVLETTESEVDSLESELKSLRSESIRGSLRPASSSSLPVNCKEQSLKELNPLQRPPPLDLLSSGVIDVEEMDTFGNVVLDAHAEVKEEEIDSPGTATSKYVEKPDSPQMPKCIFSEGVAKAGSASCEAIASIPSSDVNKIIGLSSGISNLIKESSVGRRDGFSVCSTEDYAHKILASNQAAAAQASEMFSKLLPKCDYGTNNAASIRVSCSKNDSLVRKRFLMRKHFLKFKEGVLSLKFRAFQHLWKEDLRLLSIRKYRAKSQKKLELSSRTPQAGCQKNRSSIRSRFASPAGSLSLVPTSDIIAYTSKLLSDSQVRVCRNNLKMPALILDEKEKAFSRFISSNGLVEDPYAAEKERSLVNPWTAEEKEVFIDKLATFGKDFRKISSFLDHKTIADCVEFYYKNHKSECFERAKKKIPGNKKQVKPLPNNTYLVTSGKKWSRGINSVSLDLLGAASAIVAHDRDANSAKLFSGRLVDSKSRGSDGILEQCSSYELEDERETTAADVLAGICGSLSSEAMSSCITSSVDPGEGCQELKCQKVGSSSRCALTPEVTQSVEDNSCSDESCGEMDPVDDWTDEEKSVFLQAFSSYGKDFLMISRRVETKSSVQCKVFFSKAWKCLGLESICRGPVNGTTITNDGNGGGGSDSEDACFVEAGPAVCSGKSAMRMDDDLPTSGKDHGDINQVMESHGKISVVNCGPDLKPDNVPPDDPTDGVSETSQDGVVVNDEDEKSVRVQDQASVGLEEWTSGQDTIVEGATIDEEVMRATGTSMDADSDCYAEKEASTQKQGIELESKDGNTEEGSSKGCKSGDSACAGKECNNQSSNSDSHLSLSCQTSMDNGESSHILESRLFELSIQAEANGKVGQDLSALEDRKRKRLSFQPANGCYLRGCSRVASQDLSGGSNFLSESNIQPEDDVKHSRSVSDTQKTCGNGDVKLFGQILTKHTEKSTLKHKENEEKSAHPHTAGMLDSEPSLHTGNDNSTLPKLESSNCLALKNLPVRSYGVWDGTRNRSGCPTIPESSMILSKYPASFSNYPLQIEQESKPIECLVNGASVIPLRESCTKIRGKDGVPSFVLDKKQRRDVLSEGQEIGLESSVSSFQQQQSVGGNGFPLNIVQVEGSYSGGISDPVAALKLHYANSQATGNGSIGEQRTRRAQ